MKRWLVLVLAIFLLLLLAACGNAEDPPTETDGATEVEDENVNEGGEDPPNGEEAEDNSDEGSSEDLMFVTVEMMDSDGNAAGTAELSTESSGVGVTLNLEGLETGPHSVEFRDAGKCEAPDFETTGEPFGGDIPDIEAGDDGTVAEEFVVEGVTLKTGEENSLLKEGGASLFIQGTDNSESVACGVITAQQ
ncbi:superoxide dismutase family protein [Planococcus shenhongbingii]|uniref:Superoxide dismutase family protein n=1 Tax=Planococcus shenhongbingii TaxID=3058398 RepID=A0ABT8NAX6_9BACL|nr:MULTISPECIES: superoxide dismutase family protein [unclassified Planococcus (in: firmicutes)]MDN7245001.1 superoxide dismutase family protein [Planococcus sp. N017]WKA58099.1 superoxide dismutase family protein [Planococcus sp. N016]